MRKNFLIYLLTLFCVFLPTQQALSINVVLDSVMYDVNQYNNTATVIPYYIGFEKKPYTGHIHIAAEITYNNKTYQVSSIGYTAFEYCIDLLSVHIPENVIEIDNEAFKGCTSLSCVTLPNSLTSIGSYAFEGCTALTSINLPNNITSIDNCAFKNCNSLVSINLPKSVTSIGSSAFEDCTSLSAIQIPSSVSSIEYMTFGGCSSLKEVFLPQSITSIKSCAFYGCTSMVSLKIPQSVTSIENKAFVKCDALTSVTVDSKNPIYDSREHCNAIIETASNTLIFGCSQFAIPSSVTSIGQYAFAECAGLTSLTIPRNIKSIQTSAFSHNKQLQTVFFENGIENIDSYAFENCDQISIIDLPSSITSIGYNTFVNCPQLRSVNISNNPYYVSENGILYNTQKTDIIIYPENNQTETFYIPSSIKEFRTRICNPHLKNVHLHQTVSYLSLDSFKKCTNLQRYIVDGDNPTFFSQDGVLFMTETDYWSGNTIYCLYAFPSGKENLVISNNITKVFGETLKYAVHLKNIDVEDGDTPISFEFRYSENTPHNNYPNTKTLYFTNSPIHTVYLGRNYKQDTHYGLFSDINTIESITFGKKVDHIETQCCLNCNQLLNVSIEGPIKLWGEKAFYHTPWQDNIPYEDSIKYYQTIPIEIHPDLSHAILKEGTVNIAEGLLKGTNVFSVKFPNSLTVIPKRVCAECKELQIVKLGNQTQRIQNSAFSHCKQLHKIFIPNTLQIIEDAVFWCCPIDTLVLPNSVKSIGCQAINDVKALILEDGNEILEVPNNNADDGYFDGPFKWLHELYIGRNIHSQGYGYAGDPFGGNCSIKKLSIGKDVKDWNCNTDLSGSYCSLKTVNIYSKQDQNPHFGYSGDVTLNIPKGTLNTYSSTSFWKNFSSINEIESVTLNKSQEIMTFSCPYDLDFSSFPELEVYVIRGFDSYSKVLISEKVTQVPAGIGVLIKGANGTFNIPCIYLEQSIDSPLKGVYPTKTLSSTEGNNYVFTMTYKEGSIRFNRISDDGICLSSNQTYLLLPKSDVTSEMTSIECPIDKSIILVDNGEPYLRAKDEYFNEILYQRNFTHTEWQALYLPFDLLYEDWKDLFDVAYLNNVHQFDDDEDGKIDRTQLEVIRVTNGKIEANIPYLIRAKETGKHTLRASNTILYSIRENGIDCSSTSTFYSFIGTYNGISGNEMFQNQYYAMNNGKLQTANSDQASLKPFRWYLAVTDRKSNSPISSLNIKIIEKGNEVTNIKETKTKSSLFDIYDINGRLIRKQAQNYRDLRPGIYIVNGKKIIL